MLGEPDRCARLILLRHPELAETFRARAVGQGDAELSRRGRHHSVAVLRALASVPIDRIFSAPAAHCRATAGAVAQDRGRAAEVEARLDDQDLGIWQGRDWAEIEASDGALVREFFADYGRVAPPGGESLGAAVDRAVGWWSDLAGSLEGRTALAVGAAPLLSGLAARLVGLPLQRAPALALPPAAFGVLDVYQDGAILRTWHPSCLDDDLP